MTTDLFLSVNVQVFIVLKFLIYFDILLLLLKLFKTPDGPPKVPICAIICKYLYIIQINLYVYKVCKIYLFCIVMLNSLCQYRGNNLEFFSYLCSTINCLSEKETIIHIFLAL